MSVTFLFMLLAILELSLPEALAIGCGVTLLQCLWKMSRPCLNFGPGEGRMKVVDLEGNELEE